MKRLIAIGVLCAVFAMPAAAMTLGARTAVWFIAAARDHAAVESGLADALDADGLVFECGGEAQWFSVDDENAVDGSCARSGAIADSESSWTETEVAGPGTVSFRWKVSSQPRLDTLSFWVDGVRKCFIAGEKDWADVSVEIAGNGVHALRWTYAKSASGTAGEDCGWLDNVLWTPMLGEMTIGTALDAPELDWTTGGADVIAWSAVASPSWDGVDACAAYADGVGGIARLATRVDGQGTISCRWRLEPGTAFLGIAFMVDGADVEICDDETWEYCTLKVSGGGEHNLAWEYYWDGAPTGDAGFLDHVEWTPDSSRDHTTTTPTPVPYVWLDDSAATILAAHDGDYETAANATAANGVNKVWECYVAGLVPTNATAVFRTVISMENGAPVVGWEPDLNEGGTKHERVYTVEGKENLTDIWAPTNSASRFFRVKVEMP